MKVEKTTTGVIIRQPSDSIKYKCLRYFSLTKPLREYFIYSGNDSDKKHIFSGERDVIYISSGFLEINDSEIQSLKKHMTPIVPREGSKVSFNMKYPPRSKFQIDCIEKLTTSKSYKITVEAKPGLGKTFIALDSISKLGLKPLIVVPSTLLKNQWIENLNELGIENSDIATNILNAPDKKFCVVTISSIENIIRDDWKLLMNTLDKANFGIKIVDESHLHLKGMLKLDAISNIKHNWYLSATLGRSDISEDNILNRALKDADRFIGNATYEEYQHEYVNVYLQDIRYYPSRKLCDEYFKYGTKGLVRSTYYNMLMNYKNGLPFMNNIITMIKRAKEIASYGKILVLVPIIDTIKKTIELIDKDPYFNKYTISGVDGSMSMSEKREAMKSDIIISTSLSMGTGVDLKDLSTVINFDQYASPIITEQIFGRLRTRKDDRETHYFDICDYVKYAKTISNWGRKRRMIIPYFPGAHPELKKLKDISV